MTLERKLAILSDAAKYDASCASSGTTRRDAQNGGLGSTEGAGICHAYTPDGRCVSLLKILMTNFCIFDCAYCVNRVSSNVERARFSVEEVVTLTLEFYRRNYIEGLFLSSGIIRSPDATMADMVRIAQVAAAGPRVQGLHPSQDHPRRRAGAAGRGGAVRRPPVDQRRAAAGRVGPPACARKAPRDHSRRDGAGAHHPRGQPRHQPRRQATRAFRACGAVDADDRGGGSGERRHDSDDRLAAVCGLRV